jgi:hypothetical protein
LRQPCPGSAWLIAIGCAGEGSVAVDVVAAIVVCTVVVLDEASVSAAAHSILSAIAAVTSNASVPTTPKNARELNAMIDTDIKERLAGIDNGMDLEMARTFNNIDQQRRRMPNNKDVEDLYDIFLAILAARAQAQNKARFDAEMKRRRG